MPAAGASTLPEGLLDGLDLAALEALAVRVATEAARLVVDERPDGLGASATKSSPTDVVTVMDTRAEELIRRRLREARPDDAVLGEEGDDEPGTSGLTWVVDPIDGTVNYLYEIPAYAVSIAVAYGDPRTPGAWGVLAAAVADAAHGTVHHAHLGGGARTSGPGGTTTLQVGRADGLDRALVGTGFGYTAQRRREQGELLLKVLPEIRDIRRIGSAALDLCAIAQGRLDGYFEVGLNPWDLAGGWLVVTEAGGVVSGPRGGGPQAALTVAGNAAVHAGLAALLDG